MEWLLVLLAGGGAALGGRYLWDRRQVRHHDAVELEGVRALADEDVTMLGEELQRLDASVGGLNEQGRLDYQRALDAYESAQRTVTRITSPDEVSKVTDTLSSGRYAIACVQARLAGSPVPELRVPCFFNPQHGPSSRDVLYTAPGRGTRTVPACAQDAARVEAGERPDVRMVTVDGRRVPYWEAGRAYLPYGEGYFVGGATASAGALGWAFDPSVADSSWGGGHHGGWDAGGYGGDAGGYDGGGGDGGSL